MFCMAVSVYMYSIAKIGWELLITIIDNSRLRISRHGPPPPPPPHPTPAFLNSSTHIACIILQFLWSTRAGKLRENDDNRKRLTLLVDRMESVTIITVNLNKLDVFFVVVPCCVLYVLKQSQKFVKNSLQKYFCVECRSLMIQYKYDILFDWQVTTENRQGGLKRQFRCLLALYRRFNTHWRYLCGTTQHPY